MKHLWKYVEHDACKKTRNRLSARTVVVITEKFVFFIYSLQSLKNYAIINILQGGFPLKYRRNKNATYYDQNAERQN